MDIAITGIGAVSPIGLSAGELAEGLEGGALGIRPAPWCEPGTLDGGFYAAIDDRFDPHAWMGDRVVAGTDGNARFALAACAQALASAGLEPADLDPLTTAVIHGTSMGGHFALARAQWAYDQGGLEALDPKTQIKMWSNMAAAQICLAYALHGPSLTVTTACASSLDALGQAALHLRAGMADRVLVGATEGGYTCDPGETHFRAAFHAAEESYGMRSAQSDPARAMLPFAADRAGIVSGEGSVFFVVEPLEAARARGANVRAVLRGYASLADAHHPSSPEPEGRWEQLVMEKAQASAGVAPGDLDAVIAHATGTPKGDQAEIRALNRVLGDASRAVVTGIKGHTGHTGASSGAMSVVAAVAAMERGRLANVRGTTTLDPEIGFDVALHEPRTLDASLVQVNAFGFGGQNSSIVLQRP